MTKKPNEMTLAELTAAGLCECCRAPTTHGPWTPEQVKEVCDDVGSDPEEFGDWCDDCFITQIGGGDAVYAQTLCGADKKLQPRRHDYQYQLLLANQPSQNQP